MLLITVYLFKCNLTELLFSSLYYKKNIVITTIKQIWIILFANVKNISLQKIMKQSVSLCQTIV